jgi:hypothetical protein
MHRQRLICRVLFVGHSLQSYFRMLVLDKKKLAVTVPSDGCGVFALDKEGSSGPLLPATTLCRVRY